MKFNKLFIATILMCAWLIPSIASANTLEKEVSGKIQVTSISGEDCLNTFVRVSKSTILIHGHN